jgi:hypothetical protein
MSTHQPSPVPAPLGVASARAVFAELLGGALDRLGVQPSPMAAAYLIELLDAQLRVPESQLLPDPVRPEAVPIDAGVDAVTRVDCLRQLGDRALFVAGFFCDSLRRSWLGRDAYREIGCGAYTTLARALGSPARADLWPQLFEELADCFGEFTEVLAEVGDRACPPTASDLPAIYARYVATGSARERRRLLRLGCYLPPLAARERSQ